MVSPNHLKTTLEAGGADELTKQIELSIVRKKMRLLLPLAKDIIIIKRTVASTFAHNGILFPIFVMHRVGVPLNHLKR